MQIESEQAGGMLDVSIRTSAEILALAGIVTGMACVLVARVTPRNWRAVEVLDRGGFGVVPGTQMDVRLTFCRQVRDTGQPLYFADAEHDPALRDSVLPELQGMRSYVAVPLYTRSGELFGTLCAFDAQPRVVDERVLEGMTRLARLYGATLDSLDDRLSASVDLADSQLQLARSRQDLMDANSVAKLREEFIAVLAHDLRNPLQAVRMGADLLAGAPLTPAQQRLVARMDQSVARMSELIDTTLDFARGRLGAGLVLVRQPCANLQADLAGIVAEVRLGHPERRILSVLDITHPVTCDPARIGQMLGNLMINAIVHGHPDSAVQVMAESTAQEFRLSVANRGAIPSDKVDRIFEPFERAEDRQPEPGLGLGLYIASQIATAHGGTLKVFSDEDAGTVFEFTLPLEAMPPARPRGRVRRAG
jgi:signal transduction histidine kinase